MGGWPVKPHTAVYAHALPRPCPMCGRGRCTLDVTWDERIAMDPVQDDSMTVRFTYVMGDVRPSFIFCDSCEARMFAEAGETVQEMVSRWYRQLGMIFLTARVK